MIVVCRLGMGNALLLSMNTIQSTNTGVNIMFEAIESYREALQYWEDCPDIHAAILIRINWLEQLQKTGG